MQAALAKNKWIDTRCEDWNLSLVQELLPALVDHDQFKIDAVLATRVLDGATQLALLDAAISATEHVLSEVKSPASGNSAFVLARNAALDGTYVEELRQLLEGNDALSNVLQQRLQLLELQDKTRTWQEIYGMGASPVASGSGSRSDHTAATDADHGDQDMDENDVEQSWQFDEDDDQDDAPGTSASLKEVEMVSDDPSHADTCQLPDFLDTPITDIAFSAAANNQIDTLRNLFKRHTRDLNPHRLDILDTIPLFSDVVEYTDLLPRFDPKRGMEDEQIGEPWRLESEEWSSESILKDLLGLNSPAWTPSSAQQLADWYRERVEELDEATGQVDNALSLVQYGAAQGLPGLDALGEQLSLLSRLVYDRRSADSDVANQQAWSLRKWREASEADIVDAYLSQSSPTTVTQDIRGQVLPYLYVLESQRERAGEPDPDLHDKLLCQWMLKAAAEGKAASLETIAAIFESSKPTLPKGQRIIKSNEDLARLALACCYGHPGSSPASTQAMLHIFDCLPSFEDASSSSTTSHALQSLVSLVSQQSPAGRHPVPISPSQFYEGLKDWHATALSRALDTLDLHLEAAEIFQRWNTPVTLQFFIKLSTDEKMQRLWADRLAKTSPAAMSHSENQGRIGQDFEDEDEWVSLLDDLCKLGGKSTYSQDDPRPAFSALSQQEITKIFFGGLLSSASE